MHSVLLSRRPSTERRNRSLQRNGGQFNPTIVPRRWWRACPLGRAAPTLVFDVKDEDIVEHGLAIVAAEHVHAVLVGHHGVLTAASADELVALWHLPPPVDRLPGASEVQAEAVGGGGVVGPTVVATVGAGRTGRGHDSKFARSNVLYRVFHCSSGTIGVGWFRTNEVVLFLQRRVVQELLDEVDVAEQHPPAAVALQAEGVQRVTERKMLMID